jgi:putative transposase
MPRQLRIEYPGAVYHIMNRGDRREPIFKDDHYGHVANCLSQRKSTPNLCTKRS